MHRTIARMTTTTPLEETVARVRAAAAHGQPLRIVGGGSKDSYGQALAGEPLDVRGLAGIVDYEPSELVVTVRPGTPLAELEAVLAERGQCLPFEPPHHLPGSDASQPSRATCGGMLAAGLTEGLAGQVAGTLAVALAAVNVFGGFLVTQRMLEMFRKKEPKGAKPAAALSEAVEEKQA